MALFPGSPVSVPACFDSSFPGIAGLRPGVFRSSAAVPLLAEVLEGLLYYYVVISDSVSWDMIADKAGKTCLGKEVVMGLAQRTREEGRQEGRQEGMQQGTRAEAIRAIDLILVNRFRMVPGTVTGRLEEIAEVERLEALMKVAVTASSADEFFAALDAEAAR